jgi:ribosomal protein S18 acetylase RimI-like enzyme
LRKRCCFARFTRHDKNRTLQHIKTCQTLQPLVRRATVADHSIICRIGNIAVEEAHRDSCSAQDMQAYLSANYSEAAIQRELSDPQNIYYLIYSAGEPAGFSKIVLNARHPNVREPNTTKLDRIYLLKEFYGARLGHELLHHNIDFSKQHQQTAMWLFTWIGNERAVRFYQKEGFEIIGTHQFRVSETHYNPNHHMLLRY